ncbi:hypothetical protein ACFSC6_01945 [Rufibacter sediminis]|uniref:Uncharacterized protein n=1 Tax=Rufibacter sediminis TaxID=2762756 RepID=A0ABR6VWT6_9BACT|nr:hypothetical protein [Rufibacter sediminis]MBC3541666.1 hypothetical protein [Rufibacter sediminis]
MKIVHPALIVFSLLLPAGATTAQTLATPPASSTTSPTPKKQDSGLGAKVNAIIKKQTPATPAPKPSTATTAPAAKQPTAATPVSAPSAVAKSDTSKAKSSQVTQKLTKVDHLITEREQLVLKYDYLKTQGNNFWGKASKEDLLAVVEALKEVLQKDEQIIHAVEQANLETRRNLAKRAAELEAESKRLNSQVRGDKRVITDNIYDLKSSLSNAQNLLRNKDRKLKDLEEELQTSKDAKFEHDAIAAFFAMLSLILIGYIVRLRNQMASIRDENHVKA